MGSNKLMANATKKVIDVPMGVSMGGYGQRISGSAGVHDFLYTKCLSLFNGIEYLVIITNDLLQVDEEMTSYIRRGIYDKHHIGEEYILVSASHTHSGPDISGDFSKFDEEGAKKHEEYKMSIADTILDNALNALENLKPARLGYGLSSCEALASNRVNKELPSDYTVSVLNIEADDRQPIAILTNYTCHPTIMGADNLLISADYPGALQNKLEKKYKNAVAMFTNGACGNQSARFTRKAQDFEEVLRSGNLLYDSVLEAIDNIEKYQENVELKACREIVDFPKRQLPTLEEALKIMEEAKGAYNKSVEHELPASEVRMALTRYQGAQITLHMIKTMDKEAKLQGEIQLLKVNDINIVGVPVELFVEYGIEIKEKLHKRNTIIIGYSNNTLGYVYNKDLAFHGGYEVFSSPFGPETGEFIVAKAVELSAETY